MKAKAGGLPTRKLQFPLLISTLRGVGQETFGGRGFNAREVIRVGASSGKQAQSTNIFDSRAQ